VALETPATPALLATPVVVVEAVAVEAVNDPPLT
jgi:hypothetical protein